MKTVDILTSRFDIGQPGSPTKLKVDLTRYQPVRAWNGKGDLVGRAGNVKGVDDNDVDTDNCV